MKTVKEISKITGISVRTLHYYDEIGLLKPTKKSEAGYRLYDDKALESLQQILFFREFDIPLKEIKSVIEHPILERNQILKVQRKMLLAKKERLERLICSIDDILKGETNMDFEVFSKEEVEEIFLAMLANMSDKAKQAMDIKYGGEEGFKTYFMEQIANEKTKKSWKKMVEWYGDKEAALDVAKHPIGEEVVMAYRKRLDAVLQKLSEQKKKGYAKDSFEIKEIIGEYAFVQKQLFRFRDEKDFMLELAKVHESNEKVIEDFDIRFGKGMSEFFAEAIYEFYN